MAAPLPRTGVSPGNVMNSYMCHCDGPQAAVKLPSQWHKAPLSQDRNEWVASPSRALPLAEERRIFTGCCRFLVATTFLTFCNSLLFPMFLISSLLTSSTVNKTELPLWSPSLDLLSLGIFVPGIFEFLYLHVRVVDSLGNTPILRHMPSKRTKKGKKFPVNVSILRTHKSAPLISSCSQITSSILPKPSHDHPLPSDHTCCVPKHKISYSSFILKL